MSIQQEVVIVDAWDADEEWGRAYPEGARAKKLLISPSIPALDGIRPNWRYLFKRSDQRYPQQFWGEVITFQIALMLGIDVPPAYAAYSEQTGHCAALIEWFYQEGKTAFVPAGNLFQRLIPEFDREKGKQHNFVDAYRLSINLVRNGWREGIADMIVLDTLIGNSDRHQENWGFLVDAEDLKASRPDFRFAPWFDNGTSLGYERWPERVASWNQAQLMIYIEKGCHHFRFNRSHSERIPHLGLFRKLAADEKYKPLLKNRMEKLNLDEVNRMMQALSQLNLPVPLDQPRREWMFRLLVCRADQMKAALQ